MHNNIERKDFKYYLLVLSMFIFAVFQIWNATEVRAESVRKKQCVVVIDPGHGGEETGAWSTFYGKTYKEEIINWKIANYTKNALNRLAPDIKVYLTKSYSQTKSISERIEKAARYNPDLLVSMHINSEDAGVAKGASVLASKGTYRPYLAAEEVKFGKFVIKELTALGIAKRFAATGGMEYRMTENNSKYPNKAARDYYGIIAGSVEANFPGVIIEHAFISNYSDVSKFLNSTAKLEKIAEADARAIINYCNTIPAGGIEKEKNGWYEKNGAYYYYKDDVVQKNKILRLSDGIYYVDKNGKRQTGWKTVNGKTFYFNSDGKAQLKWLTLDGERYYFNSKDGFMYANRTLVSASKNIYIFASDGKLAKGWTTYNKKKYYIGSYGYASRGFKKIDGKYYYFDPTLSYMHKSKLLTLGDQKDIYYLESTGAAYTNGFKTVTFPAKSLVYYFNNDGKAQKGWLKLENKWYYFNSKSGFMYRNSILVGASGKIFRFDENGVCQNKGN